MKWNHIYQYPDAHNVYFGGFGTYRYIDHLPVGSIFIYHPPFHISARNIWRIPGILKQKKKSIKFIFGVGDYASIKLLRLIGCQAVLLNHNMHINENEFNIVEKDKEYNGVVVSQLLKCKRLDLLSESKNLAFITYGESKKNYSKRILDSKFYNYINTEWVPRSEMNDWYNSTQVYIILSSREGPNLATVEALLCGCAVVTTRSVGGRALFLHKSNSIVVSNDAKSVWMGIIKASEAIKNRDFDRLLIRGEVLKKINLMRNEFHEVVCRYSGIPYPYTGVIWKDGIENHIGLKVD